METKGLDPNEVAKMGGDKIKKLYGSEYFRQLQAKRKVRRGRYSK